MTTVAMLPFDAASDIWADVTPVPQDDGPSPLCPILYSPAYSSAMDLIRALLPADELSPRTLMLTEHLSQICPSSYTIWHYRARILIHGPETGPNGLGNIKERLQKELKYLDELATKNMKNYQVWQHRKLIVTALGDPTEELEFSAQVLRVDSKNYHTWVYRQWTLAYFGGLPKASEIEASNDSTAGKFPDLWKGELDFVDKLLKEDARNNSAWNHRYFCIFANGWSKINPERCQEWWNLGKTFDQIVKAEIAYAKEQIATIPNNGSAWNYLRGVSRFIKGNPYECAVGLAKTLIPSASEVEADPALDAGGKTPSLALEWLLDDAEATAMKADQPEQRQEAIDQVGHYVKRLCIADPIRSRYWRYRLLSLNKSK